MNRLRQIIREAITNPDGSFSDDIEIPGIPKWGARPLYKNQGGWEIFELIHPKTKEMARFERFIGAIYNDGSLKYDDSFLGTDPFDSRQYGKVYVEKNHENLINNPIQAARYLFLKKQKPLTEAFHRVPQEITSPDLKGWTAEINTAKNAHVRVFINDDKGDWVGFISDTGILYYKQEANNPTGQSFNNDETSGIFDYENKKSIIQAMRYAFLKMQKPVG